MASAKITPNSSIISLTMYPIIQSLELRDRIILLFSLSCDHLARDEAISRETINEPIALPDL